MKGSTSAMSSEGRPCAPVGQFGGLVGLGSAAGLTDLDDRNEVAFAQFAGILFARRAACFTSPRRCRLRRRRRSGEQDLGILAGVGGVDHHAGSRPARSLRPYGGRRSWRPPMITGMRSPRRSRLPADVGHLVERRRDQPARTDRLRPRDGLVDDALGLDHDAQVADSYPLQAITTATIFLPMSWTSPMTVAMSTFPAEWADAAAPARCKSKCGQRAHHAGRA